MNMTEPLSGYDAWCVLQDLKKPDRGKEKRARALDLFNRATGGNGMSYMRVPYYIYPSADGVNFCGTVIPDDQIDVLIYSLMKTIRRDELVERLKNGRKLSMEQVRHQETYLSPENRKEYVKNFLELASEREDILLKGLIGNFEPDIEYLSTPDPETKMLNEASNKLFKGEITIDEYLKIVTPSNNEE